MLRFDVDLDDLAGSLKREASYVGGAVLGRHEDILGSTNHEYRRVDDGFLGHIQNFAIKETYRYRLIRRELVSFHFVIEGQVWFPTVARDSRTTTGRLRITANFCRESELRASAKPFRAIGLYVDKQKLVDDFGLMPDRLPEHIKPLFLKGGVAQTLEMSLCPASWLAVEDLTSSRFCGRLREAYFNAKAQELICLVVSRLNQSQPGAVQVVANSTSKDMHAVEAAALIYRRELSNPPSIDDLARRVGLNRNSLSEAFRERFGETPASFSRRMRLEWAREQLNARTGRVSEIAMACGYTSHAAFSRSFLEQFGKPPSKTKSA